MENDHITERGRKLQFVETGKSAFNKTNPIPKRRNKARFYKTETRTPFNEEADSPTPEDSPLKKGYITFYKYKQRPDFLDYCKNAHDKRFENFNRTPHASSTHKPIPSFKFQN